MPSKFKVCEHCGIGWIAKRQRKWFPQCWHCGCAWGNDETSTSESEDPHVWAWPARPLKARQIRQAQRAAEHHAAGQVTKPVFKALNRVWSNPLPQAAAVQNARDIGPPEVKPPPPPPPPPRGRKQGGGGQARTLVLPQALSLLSGEKLLPLCSKVQDGRKLGRGAYGRGPGFGQHGGVKGKR